MAYDAARGRTVLFGGVDQNGAPQSDTWEWDGTVWTSVITNSPGARYGHALAFDAARQRTVLFGGYASTAMPAMQDTWEYDGTTWVPRYDVGFPPGRNGHALTYDSDRRKVVLFGGYTGTANLDDTWEYDGTPWQQVQIAAKPHARHGHGLFYDTVMRQVVVFGGTDGTTYRNDTWALTSYSAPDVTFLGSGHPGASPGQPSGGLWIGSSPAVLGSPLTVRFRNSPSLLPPSPAPAFHLLAIGFPQNPPLPIAGPPGVCAPGVIHAFPQILLQALAPAGQEAVFTIPIPDEPALIGVQEGVQGGSLETPSCFRLTDGIKVRIRR
jgi:hypothetical protein